MSLEESDDLNILDVEPVGPVLEAGYLLKFDMHLHRSSLTEIQVKWLVKCYGIPKDLRPRVAPKGMTMNALPHDAIGLYAHHFQQGGLRVPFSSFFLKNRVGKNCKPCLKDAPTSLKKWKDKFFLVNRRATPIAMAWRHHDSIVADPFPKSREYDASDVVKLREDSKGKVVTMAEFLRLPNFKGCKVAACALLPPGTARVTHLASLTKRLEDLPLKTRDMVTAEIPCRKAERVAGNKDTGKEGASKKRRVRIVTLVQPDSEHVSSPIPLNHAKPLETLANEEHVSPTTSAGRMGALQNQTDKHTTPPPIVNAKEFVTGGEGVQENDDATFANEGHGDNEGRHPKSVEKPARDKAAPDVTPLGVSVIYLSLPKGLTDSCRMDNSRLCRDMMSNLFTPADQESFNEGMRNESAIKRSWKLLCQSAQHYDGALTREKSLQDRLEELEDEKKETDQLNTAKSDRIKQLEEALRQFEADAH
ncbi:hypothetical protein Tco_1262005 [Tanacetum coccineum]